MLFSSIPFLYTFLPCVLILYFLVPGCLKNTVLLLSSLFYSLQLHSGSFPKPLSAEEERHYLELSAQGDLEARNILVERNLRLVAHVMNKG